MKPSILNILLATIISGVGFWGCLNEAERGNPLDPKSSNFKNVGSVSGRAVFMSSPLRGIGDVEVRLEPGPFITRTDANGLFRFEEIPVDTYSVNGYKEDFAKVQDTIVVSLGTTAELEMQFNGLPRVTSVSVISLFMDRWFPDPLFALEVKAQVDDSDGFNDIALVEMTIPGIGFIDTLEFTQTPGLFQKTFAARNFPAQKLHSVIGHEIFVQAKDRGGFTFTSPSKFVARVIKELPKILFPRAEQIITDVQPTLLWQAAESVDFNYTYRIEMFRIDEIFENLVFIKEGISQNDTSFTVEETLRSGTHFWTLRMTDEFGNWSRTREASFKINSGN